MRGDRDGDERRSRKGDEMRRFRLFSRRLAPLARQVRAAKDGAAVKLFRAAGEGLLARAAALLVIANAGRRVGRAATDMVGSADQLLALERGATVSIHLERREREVQGEGEVRDKRDSGKRRDTHLARRLAGGPFRGATQRGGGSACSGGLGRRGGGGGGGGSRRRRLLHALRVPTAKELVAAEVGAAALSVTLARCLADISFCSATQRGGSSACSCRLGRSGCGGSGRRRLLHTLRVPAAKELVAAEVGAAALSVTLASRLADISFCSATQRGRRDE